jgi:hypothetical protein
MGLVVSTPIFLSVEDLWPRIALMAAAAAIAGMGMVMMGPASARESVANRGLFKFSLALGLLALIGAAVAYLSMR